MTRWFGISSRARLAALVLLGFALFSRDAGAFERQWHLGAGLGVAAPGSGYQLGGALGLHAAYGISDVFDARMTLESSLHEITGERVKAAQAGGEDIGDASGVTSLSRASLGLAYKLDVIEWVPYFGVRAGAYYFASAPLAPFSRGGGAIGGMAGCDYSFSRNAALGLELSYDQLLPEGTVFGALLRAEYRWGF